MNQDAAQLLVDQVRRGEPSAWEELIARYEGRLLAFAESRLRSREAAEDVVQEAFLGFLVSLPNYDDATPLESFLFSITAHKIVDALRRQGRRPQLPLTFDSSSSPGTPEPVGNARRPSSLAQSGERRRGEELLLAGVLAEVAEHCRTHAAYERLKCLELIFVSGWPNKEVAARLGITEQAVANHKQFVTTKLKTAAAAVQLKGLDWARYGLE